MDATYKKLFALNNGRSRMLSCFLLLFFVQIQSGWAQPQNFSIVSEVSKTGTGEETAFVLKAEASHEIPLGFTIGARVAASAGATGKTAIYGGFIRGHDAEVYVTNDNNISASYKINDGAAVSLLMNSNGEISNVTLDFKDGDKKSIKLIGEPRGLITASFGYNTMVNSATRWDGSIKLTGDVNTGAVTIAATSNVTYKWYPNAGGEFHFNTTVSSTFDAAGNNGDNSLLFGFAWSW